MPDNQTADTYNMVHHVLREFDAETAHLMDLLVRWKPGSEDERNWSGLRRTPLLLETHESMERVTRLVERLRDYQTEADPVLQTDLDAAIFAGEIKVEMAGETVLALCELQPEWQMEWQRPPVAEIH